MTDFDSFWKSYPRRVAKGAARKAWEKAARLEPELLTKCLAALAWQRESSQWVKDGGDFVPYPATYLNQERWADERPATTRWTAEDEAAHKAMRARVVAEQDARFAAQRDKFAKGA